MTIACGCGRREYRVGCNQPQLCLRCRQVHSRRWRRRIVRAMDAHLRAARSRWSSTSGGKRPGIYLITLTTPHSGDLEVDRRRMGEAWRRLSKEASYRRWWSAHALVYEATGGSSGEGHLHAHVAVVSSWVPYAELHEAWRRAMPGAEVLDVQAPGRARSGAGQAAQYLSKYVTKGVDPGEFSGRKAGELLVAFRGRRKVTTSKGFWTPLLCRQGCRSCGLAHRLVGAPVSLQTIAPGAVLRAHAELAGWWVPRGPVQSGLRWEGG